MSGGPTHICAAAGAGAMRAEALCAGLRAHGVDARWDEKIDTDACAEAGVLLLVQGAGLASVAGLDAAARPALVLDLPWPERLGADFGDGLTRLLALALEADRVCVATPRGRIHVGAWLQAWAPPFARPELLALPHCVVAGEAVDAAGFALLAEEQPFAAPTGEALDTALRQACADIDGASLLLESASVPLRERRPLPERLAGVAGHRLGPDAPALASAALGVVGAQGEVDTPPALLRYLASGLPVIVDAGVELGAQLEGEGAAFRWSSGDAEALGALLRSLAADPQLLADARASARRFAAGALAPKTACAELAAFCRAPRRRAQPVDASQARRIAALEAAMASLEDGHQRLWSRVVDAEKSMWQKLTQRHRRSLEAVDGELHQLRVRAGELERLVYGGWKERVGDALRRRPLGRLALETWIHRPTRRK